MKIGIDLTFIRPDHKNGGTESSLKNLMKGLLAERKIHDYLFLIHKDLYEDYRKLFPEAEFYVYQMKGKHPVRMILFQTFYLTRIIKEQHIDLMYFPTFQSGLLRKFKVPVVVNTNDIQYKYYPEYFSFLKRKYYDLFYKRAMQKADAIVAISGYVKNTLLEYFGRWAKGKIEVLYVPVDLNRAEEEKFDIKGTLGKEEASENNNYILCINSLTRHKNLITLLKAYDMLEETYKEKYRLVIGGAKWNGANELSDYIAQNGLENQVCLTGFLSEGQLTYLYRHARLFVTPSLYEGFGMTPLEAMGAMCPVVSSRETSLYEVTQGLVHYYEPATDAAALCRAITEELAHEPDIKLLERNKEATKRYEVETVAANYRELFEKVYEKWSKKQ